MKRERKRMNSRELKNKRDSLRLSHSRAAREERIPLRCREHACTHSSSIRTVLEKRSRTRLRGRIEVRVSHSFMSGREREPGVAAGVTRLRKVMRVYRTRESVGGGGEGGNGRGKRRRERKRERETHALGMQALNNRQ